jgi:hypothetical protein
MQHGGFIYIYIYIYSVDWTLKLSLKIPNQINVTL